MRTPGFNTHRLEDGETYFPAIKNPSAIKTIVINLIPIPPNPLMVETSSHALQDISISMGILIDGVGSCVSYLILDSIQRSMFLDQLASINMLELLCRCAGCIYRDVLRVAVVALDVQRGE